MPDRDTFVEHVPKRWRKPVRMAFEPELCDTAIEHIVRQLAHDVRGQGCPCLNSVCSYIHRFEAGSRSIEDYEAFLAEIDSVVVADSSWLGALMGHAVRSLFPPIVVIDIALATQFSDARESLIREGLVTLASKHVFSAVQLQKAVEQGRWSFKGYTSRRSEVQDRLRDSRLLGRLIEQIVACPDGSTVTVPRLAIPVVPTAEQLHQPLLTTH